MVLNSCISPFDIDQLDQDYAPGKGKKEHGGLKQREEFQIVRRMCAEMNMVGMEVVKVAHGWDPG